MAEPPISVQSSQDSSTPPSRTFVDDDGAHWTVYEHAFGEYDRRSSRSLIFNSDSAVRRVRNYPANWLELSERELMELSWKA
jgi:hypothetical protein